MYILEMANNHMGDVEHGKLIIDNFAYLVNKYEVNAAIKLQFRQLDSFIHKDFVSSNVKHVKRFKDTELSKDQFKELFVYIRKYNLKTCCTAFDNASIPWLEELDVSIIKVGSCSVDDWPLLEELSDINKKIIISTAGADFRTLHRVYDLFKNKNRDFAFMHCVADYPTPHDKANLKRIKVLQNEFPDIEIGYSTHERATGNTAVHAVIMGCNIIEKHIGLPTDEYHLNDYSLSPEEFRDFLEEVECFNDSYLGKSETEKESLRSLKRGVYFKRDIIAGAVISEKDIYFAMPVQDLEIDYHFDASDAENIIGKVLTSDVYKDSVVTRSSIKDKNNGALEFIVSEIRSILAEANIAYDNQEIELSCHYGLHNFYKTGCGIITKINREYCKKLIVCLPDQRHPSHRHIQKEECFELLHGDCTVKMDHEEIELTKGVPLLVPVGTNHSFRSNKGCVLEEISTRHVRGDSIYSDPSINKLPLDKRKIITRL
jgi:N-acetylneuraminate synthase